MHKIHKPHTLKSLGKEEEFFKTILNFLYKRELTEHQQIALFLSLFYDSYGQKKRFWKAPHRKKGLKCWTVPSNADYASHWHMVCASKTFVLQQSLKSII